ncbi:DUF4175 family protein [Thalassoroseus pseudoceratinae]|uniref:DUF4175 family protein n=1 Tax=Thalassoroseus pseudoceratinae TaxID=2713176 RepID=UPI0014234317|nr:DUF4175 family protein [Thalassoroseus pseudoceratinae]
MIDRQLARRLEPVARRLRQLRLSHGLTIIWLIAANVAVVALCLGPVSSRFTFGLIGTTCVIAVIYALCVWRMTINDRRLAWRIESKYPDLNASLLTAIEQQPNLANGQYGYGYLQQDVLRRALTHSELHSWKDSVPKWRVWAAHLVNGLSVAVWILLLLALFDVERSSANTPDGLAFEDVKVTENLPYELTVEPGDADIERGSSLLVLARFTGPLPPDATLVTEDETGNSRQIALAKSLDDPVFGGRIAAVDRPLTYKIAFAKQESNPYQVTVFEFPRLQQADAKLHFPSYTNQDDKLVQDVRRVSAIEGTEVTLVCRLNKPVRETQLIEDGQEPIVLVADPDEPTTVQTTLTLDRSRRLELKLTDSEGRQNRDPAEFVLKALPNRPPDLKLTFPAKDMQVSPIEELNLAANAWDDYGLKRFGLNYNLAGSEGQEIVLAEDVPAKERLAKEHVLSFENLAAEPDQLVSYYFWAEDIGPDGERRRTSGDLYFAEVRHFEEIFRQGQQPTASQQQQQQQQNGGNAQQAQKLAELQKQIINALWKIVRRETRDQPTKKFADDLGLVLESQISALEQTKELAENLQDAQSQTYVEAVQQHMQETIVELGTAHEQAIPEKLQPALASAQSAYQALLKLRAREHEVVRSQQQQSSSQSSSSSSSSRSQQQLQQLELDDDENRYETQQTASPQETQEQREDRQVLNRLRELAQRQNDLNDRVKELQSALDEAQTQAEKEELERQLKRLREEQQQILRNMEELDQRMTEPGNQERMNQERQQLQQARENARQSSEALQEGMVSQAAAEGTRAEQELRELQDEFQRRTANQFNEDVRKMQEQVRKLEQREQELAENLKEMDQPKQPSNSLRGESKREKIAEQLQQQRQDLNDLLDRMRETIEQAETTEPLLAEELYETIRNTRRENPETALESAERSFNRGFVEDARQQERIADRGISSLREGIEKAAESVLGDETEALKRAEQELRQLSRELDREIAEADPQAVENQAGNNSRENAESNNANNQDAESSQQNPSGQSSSSRSQRNPNQTEGEQQNASENGSSPESEQPMPNGQQSPSGGQSPNNEESQDGRQSSNEERQPNDEQSPSGQQSPGGQRSQQSSEQQQPGQANGNGGQPSGESQPNGSQPSQPRPGQRPNGGQPGERGGDDRNLGPAGMGGLDQLLNPSGNRPPAPLTGEGFLDWSDRLRDVEEIVSDPELRAEAARIRDRAKAIRKDFKRHSQPPNWDVVRETIAEPLAELQNRVSEELLRRSAKDALVPLNRDPVPTQYAEQVQRYFERLGTGQE